MRESLLRLVELQKVDNELQALEDLRGDLPQKVEKIESELHALKDDQKNKKTESEELARNKMHLEGELQVFKDKLGKYQDQLYAVTSNREYDAITVEIDEMKAKIDETETRILELLEREESLKEELQSLESQIESYESDLKTNRAELERKIKETENEHRVWRNKRQDLVGRLNRPILYQYERIRRVRGETAVVNVSKYACGGCFSAIPPQRVVEIRHMNELHTCESCGRILISDDEEVAVAN